ncbi:MAG: autotransporter domain-containing protein [Verrucomicrobia bacterium]|nr:autotransporter domain-containing protein [Verrucomicrobiota bacterium]
MKNPVQSKRRTFQWAAALGVVLTSNALLAEPADSYLPATAFWLDMQGLSSPRIADTDFGGSLHISLLTPTNTIVHPSLDLARFAENHGKLLDPALSPGPIRNWANPAAGNWFFSKNWSNGVPNSTSSVVVANGGTAVIEATPTPTPPPDGRPAKRKAGESARPSAKAVNATAQVGTLTIGSVNGPGGKVIDAGPHAVLNVFQSLTVEANGTLKSLAGPAVFILNGGTATNLGVISSKTEGLVFTNGGTLLNEAGGSVSTASGTAIVVESGNETVTNLGTITGGNGIAIDATAGSGNTALTNAGTINGNVELGSGTNTVTLITGSSLKGNLNLGTNSASGLVLDGSGQEALSHAVSGTITDPGTLTKQGSGTWIIDENLSAPISTDLIAGTLTVAQNATLTSPTATIGSAGLLLGTGTISGNVTNSGIISPGNPFGTLTIRGNYTQTSDGVFRLELGGLSPGEFGMLAVTGNATLSGTLQLIRAGNFQFLPGDKLVFLTANSVTGSFSTIENLNTIVNARVIVLPDSVEILGTQGDFVSAACNPNSVAVAKALDSAIGDPRAAALISFLDSQPVSELCPDFTLIAPEELTAIFSLDVSLANIQTANLERRLGDIRSGSNGFSSSGFTINGSAPTFSTGLSGPTGAEGKTGPSVSAPIPENRWGFFATGLGEFTDVSTADGARGFNFRTGGVTLGVDYRIGSNFAVGLTGGYAHTGVDLSGNGSIDVDGGSGGFYATAFGNGFYLDTSVTGGASDYETHRTALLGTANGSTDSDTINVLVAGGYDWTTGPVTIGPIASFQYTYVSLNGFTETGSLAPLRFGDQSVDSIRSALGIKASYDWKIGGVLVRPELRASWQHEYGDSTYSIVASFANGAGTNFTVNGPPIGRDSLLIGAGVAILWNDRISTYIYYDGELARTNYDSQSVTAGFRITF